MLTAWLPALNELFHQAVTILWHIPNTQHSLMINPVRNSSNFIINNSRVKKEPAIGQL
jgi:hypothetical protein